MNKNELCVVVKHPRTNRMVDDSNPIGTNVFEHRRFNFIGSALDDFNGSPNGR